MNEHKCITCGNKIKNWLARDRTNDNEFDTYSFCSMKCSEDKITMIREELRFDFKDYFNYGLFFKILTVHREGIRYEQRQPPIWMQINISNKKCWCGKPKSQFEKHMRKYCCNEHSRFWYYYINSYWDSFRLEIFKRDNWTCQECGIKFDRDESKFDADHILAICLGGECFDERNVRTICKDCHKIKTASDKKELSNLKKGEGFNKLDLYC